MTPEELRVRAFRYIETAKNIVLQDPGHASYTVGYAIEYVLKARFCEKIGIADFPDDRPEARRLQIAHAFTHNLRTLISLNSDVAIDPGSMLDVDWDHALDWDVDRRYEPVDARTPGQVIQQIIQTERACTELCHYDIVSRLRDVEVAVSAARGPFNYFAFSATGANGAWETVFAFWPLDHAERGERERLIDHEINRVLDRQLRLLAGNIRSVHPEHQGVQPFYAMYGALVGPIQHSLRMMTRNNVVVGYPVMPHAWLISCARYDEESVIARVNALQRDNGQRPLA